MEVLEERAKAMGTIPGYATFQVLVGMKDPVHVRENLGVFSME